jgi:hypothetical protein
MKVTNMTSPRTGRDVPNQFIITDDYGNKLFQSYRSVIARVSHKVVTVPIYDDNGECIDTRTEIKQVVQLDRDKWDYSTTTGKYRDQFLGETKKETQAKIDSGEYILTDLNG